MAQLPVASDTELSAASWLADAAFVDAVGAEVAPSKVASNELIGVSHY